MLSERQQNILDFINQFLDEEGFPPTIREIQKSCDISSTSVVSYNIEALRKKGHLEVKSNKSRGIINNPLEIPEDIGINYEEEIEIPIDWFPKNKNIFALEVKGDSMSGDMISDGDVIIAEKIVDITEINSNQIGVINIKDENSATLKRISFNKDQNEVTLIPSNPDYLPITKKASNIKIEGKVLGLLRSFNT